MSAFTALARLADAGIAMISQTVLLKGVNDDVETLEALMRAFLRNRVKPYYLHQMDPAPGTAHFDVPVERGRELIRTLRDRMTGLGIPAYVLDGPSGRKRHLGPEES
jgi:lysine 2,3-aminomutase